MTNAYGCCSHERLDEVLHDYLPYADANVLQDRRRTRVLHVEAVDGDMHLVLTTGALMGETSAPDEFRVDLLEPINTWPRRSPQPQLMVKC
eukprot:5137068-Pyramimonas_sp.AAC.1